MLFALAPVAVAAAGAEEVGVVEDRQNRQARRLEGDSGFEFGFHEETPVPSANDDVSLLSATPTAAISAIFPDPVFAAIVAEGFGRAPSANITQAELDEIQWIQIWGTNLTNLQGIQFFRNAIIAELDENNISNLAPLSGMTQLLVLYLPHNPISNIQPLAGLTNLIALDLGYAQISNIQPLAGLTRLEELFLDSNRISNVQPLAGLRALEELDLSVNQIRNISALSALTRLEFFWAEQQSITLPPARVAGGAVTLQNPIINLQGNPAHVGWASHSGIYQVPNVRWTGLADTVLQVSYAFNSGNFDGTVTVPLSDTPFSDVHRGHWYNRGVADSANMGIVDGVGDGRFEPYGNFSRAMAAATLYRIVHGGTAREFPYAQNRPIFTDVFADSWYSPYIAWAYDNGVVRGVSDGRFAPHDHITREQFALLMHQFAGFRGYETAVRQGTQWNSFTDRDQISTWAGAEAALMWANYHGIINGRTTTTIVPGGFTNRAEAATLLIRFIQTF